MTASELLFNNQREKERSGPVESPFCSERKPSQSCEGFFCSEAGERYVHAMSALCSTALLRRRGSTDKSTGLKCCT